MNDWQSAEHHAERAHRFYKAGQWERALSEIRAALRINPEHDEWQLGLGLTLEALGRHAEAERCFSRALASRAGDTELMLHLAICRLRIGEPESALATLDDVLELDDQLEAAYCHRILAYAELGQHDQAELNFYLARQIADDCPRCLDHIAQSLAMRDELDRAVWCWQRALELDPQFPQARANLARVWAHRGDHERAYDLYLRELQHDPNDVQVLMELGRLLVEMDRSAEAAEKFRRVLELSPTEADAHLHLGEIALLSNHRREARLRLETVLRLDPDRPGVHLLLGRVAQAQDDPDTARRHAEAEMRCQTRTPLHTLELSRLFFELDQPERSIALLGPVVEQGLEHRSGLAGAAMSDDLLASTLLCRGAALLAAGRCDAGISDCRRVLRLDPRNALAMRNLIIAYIDQGSFSRARHWLRRARELSPHDPLLDQLAGRLLRLRVATVLRRWRSRARAHARALWR